MDIPRSRMLRSRMLATATLAVALALPLTATAQDAPVEYENTPLSDTLTMVKGRGGNVVVSAGDDGVFLVDDQLKPISDQLLAHLRTISEAPIRFVINTHYHGDHVGGNETMDRAGAVTIAHDNVRQRMTTEQFSNFMGQATEPWPADALPVVTFNDRVTLHFNGESVAAVHVARGHTDGDAIIHFPESNVIHMGDIFFRGIYPFIDLDGGGTVQGMIDAVDKALEMADADTKVVPGHGSLSTRDDLAAYGAFLAAARDRVKVHVDAGESLEETIAARPTAEWDDTRGRGWIKPPQFVTFIYNSLKGVDEFTPIPENTSR